MTQASTYARGGAKWNAIAAAQGEAAADAAWQAAIDAERNGRPLDTSTFDIFTSQLYNDPFGAPIEQGNKILGNTFSDAFKNPYVAFAILALVVAVALWFFGPMLRKKFM
jgi:hypothetical protein